MRQSGGKDKKRMQRSLSEPPKEEKFTIRKDEMYIFKKQIKFSFPDVTAQGFVLFCLGFFYIQTKLLQCPICGMNVKERTEETLGMLDIESSRLTPSTVTDVLQFFGHVQDNLIQTRQNHEGFKQNNLRKQKIKLH